MKTIALTLIFLFFYACATTSSNFSNDDITKVDKLLQVMQERLALSEEVAKIKWNTKTPIDDPAREKSVLDKVTTLATTYSIEPNFAILFFQGQINASKIVQRRFHAQWTNEKQPSFSKTANLTKEIRPALDALTPKLLQELSNALLTLKRPGGTELLNLRVKVIFKDNSSAPSVYEAVRPLLDISN